MSLSEGISTDRPQRVYEMQVEKEFVSLVVAGSDLVSSHDMTMLGQLWYNAFCISPTREQEEAYPYAVQDQVTETSWTETLSTLGWTADEIVTGGFCRDANNGSDTLSGDANALNFTIQIPRTQSRRCFIRI